MDLKKTMDRVLAELYGLLEDADRGINTDFKDRISKLIDKVEKIDWRENAETQT